MALKSKKDLISTAGLQLAQSRMQPRQDIALCLTAKRYSRIEHLVQLLERFVGWIS
jgi:hypothetical protein